MTTRVEDLRLYSDFDQDQLKAILQAIAEGPGKLKKVTISTSLDKVGADLLACAVNNLEEFENNCDYGDSEKYLSIYQMEKILNRALEGTSLKRLMFPGYERLLDPELLKDSKKAISDLYIFWADTPTNNSDEDSDSDSYSESDSDSVSDPDPDQYSGPGVESEVGSIDDE